LQTYCFSKSHGLRHFRYTHLQKCKVHPAIQNYWIGYAMKGMSEVYGHIHEDVALRQRLAQEVTPVSLSLRA
jgi:hypothetical protein